MASRSNRFQRRGESDGDGRVATEEREVRSEDPSLTPEANALVTDELRDVVGSDRVRVPADAPDSARERHGDHGTYTATLAANRGLLIITFLMALVVGGTVALASGEPWLILVPIALHAISACVVPLMAVQMSTQTEHVSPTTAAKLEEEGVADPDRLLGDLVEEFEGARMEHGAVETLSQGENDSTTRPDQDAGEAAVEQQTAWTPSSGESRPAGTKGAVAFLPWWLVGGAAVLSLVALLVLGLEGWIVPALLIPMALIFVFLQGRLAGSDEDGGSERRAGDAAAGVRRSAPVIAGIAALSVIGVLLLLIASDGI